MRSPGIRFSPGSEGRWVVFGLAWFVEGFGCGGVGASGGCVDDGDAVGSGGVLPAGFVYEEVVVAAFAVEVVGAGFAAGGPVVDVVDVGVLGGLVAAGFLARAGAGADEFVQIGRGPVLGAADGEELAGVRVGDQPGPGVGRVEQPFPDHLEGNVPVAREVGGVVVQPQ